MANAASSASSPGAGSSSSQQAGGDGGGDAHTPRQRQGRPPRAGSDPLLIVCGCFSVVTVATALLCVAVNVVSAVQSFRAGFDIFGGIFRCYAVVFSLFVAVLETEWGFIIRFWKVGSLSISSVPLVCFGIWIVVSLTCREFVAIETTSLFNWSLIGRI